MSHEIEDWYLAHPRIDFVIPAITLVGTYLLLSVAHLKVDDSTAALIAAGISTVAGLSMASCVFVCTLTYQSSHPKIVSARQRHSDLARRNWIAIIRETFIAALIPLCSLLLIDISGQIVVCASALSAGLVIGRFTRSMLWLSLMLFASDQPSGPIDHPRRVLRPTA